MAWLENQGETKATARILFKSSEAILAGTNVVDALAKELNLQVEWHFKEASNLQKGQTVGIIRGKLSNILSMERLALNLLTRLTGIATKCERLKSIALNCGFSGMLAGTRKTTPGLNLLEKYAMSVGGFAPHRANLSESPIIIKDNHFHARKDLLNTSLRNGNFIFNAKIEVECDSLEMAVKAAKWGADIVMLDNFSPSKASEAVMELKKEFPHLLVEISGGIDEENIQAYASIPNVDIISCGAVTQKVVYADFSLQIIDCQWKEEKSM